MTKVVPNQKVQAMCMTMLLLIASFVVLIGFIPEEVAGNFTSSEEVSDDTASEAQNNADLAVDSVGNLYAVWDDMFNGTDRDIYFSNSSDGGLIWEKPNIKVNLGAGDQTKPAIAVNQTSGDLYVVWQDDRVGERDVYFAKSIDGGVTWSSPNVLINDNLTDRQTSPDIVWDPQTGAIHVVWEDLRNTVDWDIYYSKSTDGGATWSPSKLISDTSDDQRLPSVAVDTLGNIYVLYQDERSAFLDYDIYFVNSTDGGDNWGTNNRVSDGPLTASQENPAISVDTGGIAYAVWEDYRGVGADIYFSTLTSLGGSWSANVPVNDVTTNSQAFPDIAVGGGVLWVVWEDGQNGDQDIYFSNSTNGGADWSAGIMVNDIPTNDQQRPAIVYSSSPSESVHVVWEDNRDSDFDIYSSRLVVSSSAPTIDRIFISRSPIGATGEVIDGSYSVSDTEDFYCVGWNDTLKQFVSLVPANWDVDSLLTGEVNPDTATENTTFTAIGEGICKVSALSAYGNNETGTLTVNADATIDQIKISLTSNGSSDWIGDQFYSVSDTQTFYACGWNDTDDEFVSLVNVTWESDDPNIGNVTSPGNSTTFTANNDGSCVVTATSDLLVLDSTTGILTVTSYDVDRIFISITFDGNTGWIGDKPVPEGGSGTMYAVGWNDTANEFVKPVDASWLSDNTAVGDVASSQGTSNKFSGISEGTCKVTISYSTFSNITGVLTVIPLEIDQIIISHNPNGTQGVGGKTYSVEDTDLFYAVGWNFTYDQILGLVEATWTSNASLVGGVDPLVGHTSNFTAKWVSKDSTCSITAEYMGISYITGALTVLAPNVDDIKIRTAPDNGGNVLDTAVFQIHETATYYAAGYNDTVGYFGDVSVAQWAISGEFGNLNPLLGNLTTFTATKSGSGTISVYANGVSHQSGTINVNDEVFNPPAPSKPGQPSLTVKSKDKIEITWPANSESDIKNYVIQRSESADGPWTNISTLGNDTVSYSDSGLKSDTTYYYRILAINDDGISSDPSPSVAATTKKEGDDGGFSWILLILLIIIILVVVFLLFFFMKKKQGS